MTNPPNGEYPHGVLIWLSLVAWLVAIGAILLLSPFLVIGYVWRKLK